MGKGEKLEALLNAARAVVEVCANSTEKDYINTASALEDCLAQYEAVKDEGDWCTNNEWPERGENPPSSRNYINNTRDLWLRKNLAENSLEIWFDGEFECSWNDAHNIEGRVTAMLRSAFGMGKRQQKKETARAFKDLFQL